MTDPFNYPFPQRTDTMSLSTVNERDYHAPRRFARESSFQKTDIVGSFPTKLVPLSLSKNDFSLSTYVEPGAGYGKKLNKVSNPLKVDDIEGAHPANKGFRTGRSTDPLNPVYKLPKSEQITVDKGKNFLRDTLKIEDINSKKQQYRRQRGMDVLNEIVPGSTSKRLAYPVQAVSRLNVNDINKQGAFQTRRFTNPLAPVYKWRDQQSKQTLNPKYGIINGTQTKSKHPIINKQGYSNLNTNDIQGAKHNSYFDRSYFLQKRRDIRDYMKTGDIQKCYSSSLKKGITTLRTTNPLVPNYKLPGNSQPPK